MAGNCLYYKKFRLNAVRLIEVLLYSNLILMVIYLHSLEFVGAWLSTVQKCEDVAPEPRAVLALLSTLIYKGIV